MDCAFIHTPHIAKFVGKRQANNSELRQINWRATIEV
jgi:hypothetical protein